MKKIIVTPDSFKGTMSSIEVCNIIEEGIKNIRPEMEVVKIPIADGGEGTIDAFLCALGGTRVHVKVKGPFFDEIEAFYGILPDGRTAVIEMAAASGLPLAGERKNPCTTTTYGTGQLIADALDKGCRTIIMGLGGSATNDGGVGMAAALGVKFMDVNGNEIPLNGEGLELLYRIDLSGRDKRLDECKFMAACDVDNPLYGRNGAAYIYAAQKGADQPMIEYLDKNLKHYSDVLFEQLGADIGEIPGAGAAGGLGAGLIAFTGSELKPGIKIILDTVNFDSIISDADLIITGEGKIDGQSLRGKVPIGVAERAKSRNIPVIALVGDIGDDADAVHEKGIKAIFSINRMAIPFEQAKLRSRQDLKKTTESIMRFIKE